MIKDGDIVEIVRIAKKDGFYNRKDLIGSQGVVVGPRHAGGGWFFCHFLFLPDQTRRITFYRVKLKKGERK